MSTEYAVQIRLTDESTVPRSIRLTLDAAVSTDVQLHNLFHAATLLFLDAGATPLPIGITKGEPDHAG